MSALYFPGEKFSRHVGGWDLRDIDIPSGRHRLRIRRQAILGILQTSTRPLRLCSHHVSVILQVHVTHHRHLFLYADPEHPGK